jgi:tRNA (cytosine40_48-C5)-methyltransferase
MVFYYFVTKYYIMKSKVIIPDKFINKFKDIIEPNEIDSFITFCKKKLTKSIRINTLKYKEDILDNIYFKENKIILKKINYISNSYFIESQVSAIGNTIEQLLGYFQIQEVSSMLPAVILNPNEKDIVLDLTAAPGNKTSFLAQIMNNKGLIIANDIDKKRIKTLKYTLKKLGVTNTIIFCKDGTDFNINIKFNKILLDAPCSCEGIVRKKPKSLINWSNQLVKTKSNLQKKLILNAYDLLDKNGELVYSTCTLSPEENEEVIDYLINNRTNVKIIPIEIKELNTSCGILNYKSKKYNKNIKYAIRIYPHKTDLEGFFICKIKKNIKE